ILGIFLPIDSAVVFSEQLCKRSFFMILWGRRDCSRKIICYHAYYKLAANIGKFFGERDARFFFLNRDFLLSKNRAIVHFFISEHDCYARLVISRKNCRLDRRRSAIAGEKRRMDIEHALCGDNQYFLRQYFPVCRDDKKIKFSICEYRRRYFFRRRAQKHEALSAM